MAALSITKGLGDLKVLFNKIKEVYFVSDTTLTPATLTTVDFELPVLSDGITFDTGAPSITKVKLTTGETWTSISEAGDSSIEMQISSVAGIINDTFLNKQGDAVSMTTTIEGNTYEGQGYDLEPKKVEGGLLMLSEDRQAAIYMPHVEIYSSFVVDQSKTGYFNLTCTPLASVTGQAIYFMQKAAA